jgi:hypothetical protein
MEIGIDRADGSFDGEIATLLGEVPGVAAAVSAPSGHGGPEVWRLALADDADQRAVGQAVVLRVIEAGLRLERFGPARPSLERIYRLAVERAEDQGPGAGAPASTASDVA